MPSFLFKVGFKSVEPFLGRAFNYSLNRPRYIRHLVPQEEYFFNWPILQTLEQRRGQEECV
jgi:hypothetical protein